MIVDNKYESGLSNHQMITVGPMTIWDDSKNIYRKGRIIHGEGREGKLSSMDFISCFVVYHIYHLDEKEIYEALVENFDPYDFLMIQYRQKIARVYDHLSPFLIPDAFLNVNQIKKIEKKFKLNDENFKTQWPIMIIACKRLDMKVLLDLTKCFGLFDESL